MFLADLWKDFEVLDTGDGEKLERWGNFIMARPDPQVIWPKGDPSLWQKAHARYIRSDKGGGSWDFKRKLPESWTVSYMGVNFIIRPTGFKHTGILVFDRDPNSLLGEEVITAGYCSGKAKVGKRTWNYSLPFNIVGEDQGDVDWWEGDQGWNPEWGEHPVE